MGWQRSIKNKGFTLIELIVVIAILAILAVALIPLINNFIEKSRVSQAMTTFSSVSVAIAAFEADTANLPDQEQITALPNSDLLNNNDNLANWDGPYVNKNANGITPWGGTFVFGLFAIPGVGEEGSDFFFAMFSEDSPPVPGLQQGNKIPGSSLAAIDEKTDGTVDPDSGTFRGDGSGTFVWILRPDVDDDSVSVPQE